MSLPASPPRYARWSEIVSSIKEGENGWRAYAVQCVVGAVPDGAFGPATLTTVKSWQFNHGLVSDGVVGTKTQAAMLRSEAKSVEKGFPHLPAGLLDGFAAIEGASVLAATNSYTPPGGVPGVDCGPVQWRQYGPPFSFDGLKKAFDPQEAFTYAAQVFTDRIADYRRRNSKLSTDTIIRAAVLAHNAPFLAEQIVRYGHLLTPNAIAVWTTKPGGGHYTHAEWAYEYPHRVLGR